MLMASSFRLVASRHLRDSATASKVLVFVSTNQLQWIHDTEGAIALQEVYRIEAVLALDVDEVAEVPAYQIFDLRHGADGHMARVARKSNNSCCSFGGSSSAADSISASVLML
jgi:hypothetical protein